MTDAQQQIDQLLRRLNSLSDRQALFQQEINKLRREIVALQLAQKEAEQKEEDEAPLAEQEVVSHAWQPAPEVEPVEEKPVSRKPVAGDPLPRPRLVEINTPQEKSDLEKFIGENLINKIGIAITVIGVGIGAKYAIDNQLISPLTRMILGYLMGIGLMGFAIKLKEKYKNFSAVLLSGAMAIMYFITYAAYDFYGLIPQVPTFGLMVLFTAFTVVAAIHYNMQIIAHIGLVGAYAVPFLLSQGEGKVAVLFSYMSIINAGILVIAYQRYWKPLYYVSFSLSWLIYLSWYISAYQVEDHFGIALCFLSIFFAIFYLTFLSYKMIRREQFSMEDVLLLLGNSFVFYAGGYAILSSHPVGEQLLGLFTTLNAGVHFGVSVLIYKKKLAEKNLFYLLAGMVLVFITIAIPVQLDGNWVTLFWAGQALLLFWIGRTRKVAVYEFLSYPLMLLAFCSILQDWSEVYGMYSPGIPESRISPVFNIWFLSSLLFIAAFAGMHWVNSRYSFTSQMKVREMFYPLINYLIPSVLLVACYYAVWLEINNYWNQRFLDSAIKLIPDDGADYGGEQYDYTLINFGNIWLINYSILFAVVLVVVNSLKLRNRELGIATLCMQLIVVAVFLSLGLYGLSELRDSYIHQSLAEYYNRGIFFLLIRYLSLAFFAGLIWSIYRLIQQPFMNLNLKVGFDYLLFFCLLWVLSSELINWLDIAGFNQTYKLGLSILWGVYALFLIALGIWRKKKHLRVGAIGLFGLTLVKLFFYDIVQLDTIAKTIVFVSLGILLLIISFLYNKYKHLIADEVEIKL